MGNLRIDHLVVAARSLGEGVEYIADTLGVRPEGGGEHKSMGTHNKVVRLGEDCYLEVIAVKEGASRPEQPRWFELDTEAMRDRLRHKPQLITWALRTDRIDKLAHKSAYPLGEVRPMSRGELHWRLTLTEDGHLPGSGIIPFLIQWDKLPHPASLMAQSGCRLAGLRGYHPQPEMIRNALYSLGAEHLIEIMQSEPNSAPSLAAAIETPGGIKTLT